MANDMMVTAAAGFSDAQIMLLKRTIAKDTNDNEFNLFIETCRLLGLNPMRRQIGVRVYNKDNPKKRQMVLIPEIGGLRAIAARQADYRPDDEEPDYTYDEKLKGPANPHGIIRAKVSAFKQDNKGVWNRVVGVAYWDELAPLTDHCPAGYTKVDTGETWPDGNTKYRKEPKGEVIKVLDDGGNWVKMPRLMIAKCAEAQALRKGWPEDMSGLYEQAEMDKADVSERLATEVVDSAAQSERLARLSGPKDGYAIQWGMGEPIEMIEPGKMFDRIMAWANDKERHEVSIKAFRATNAHALQRFWGYAPGDALELKKALETREAELVKNFATAQ